MGEELARLDATAQAELVRSGEASPVELVEAAIARIEAVNGEINAVIHPLFEEGLAAAQGELPDGPFRGVPFLLKDLGAAFAGQPLHLGMRYLKERDFRAPGRHLSRPALPRRRPGDDRQDEHARAGHPADRPSRAPTGRPATPGTPSTRPAARAAARRRRSPPGMVPMAHANDGGGSIRIPASYCGLVGLKPSRQRTSEGPLVGDYMSGLTVELAVSRSVRDIAAILDAVHGPAPGDPYVAPPPLRPYTEEVGADPASCGSPSGPRPMIEQDADPEVVAAARAGGEAAGGLRPRGRGAGPERARRAST